jgi:hypothetical protein
MRVISSGPNGATVECSADELRLLNNAMNETLEALDDDEFETRVGAGRDAMTSLLDEVHSLVVSLPTG